jgi:hypothetical protein
MNIYQVASPTLKEGFSTSIGDDWSTLTTIWSHMGQGYTQTVTNPSKQWTINNFLRRFTKHQNSHSSAHSIFLSPVAGRRLVLGPVCLVHVSDLRDKRIIRVGISQQGTDGEQDLWNIQATNILINSTAALQKITCIWIRHVSNAQVSQKFLSNSTLIKAIYTT